MFDVKIMKPDEIRVIDNFLDKKTFKDLQNTLLNESQFPWFLNYNKVKNDGITQFTHMFYYDFIPNSSYYNNLLPFFKILKPNAIKRVKANLTIKASEVKPYNLHQDFDDNLSLNQMKTAIYFLNTTNGPSIFENNFQVQKIDCIENRIIIFPTKILHAGSSHTNAQVRGVINFNWF